VTERSRPKYSSAAAARVSNSAGRAARGRNRLQRGCGDSAGLGGARPGRGDGAARGQRRRRVRRQHRAVPSPRRAARGRGRRRAPGAAARQRCVGAANNAQVVLAARCLLHADNDHSVAPSGVETDPTGRFSP